MINNTFNLISDKKKDSLKAVSKVYLYNFVLIKNEALKFGQGLF